MLVFLGFLSLAQAMAHRGWSMSVPRDYSTEEENLRAPLCLYPKAYSFYCNNRTLLISKL